MKPLHLAYLGTLLLLLLTALPSAAEEPPYGRGWGRQGARWAADESDPRPPFGAYCPRRHADFYGASQPVRSADDARDRLAQFFNRSPAQIILLKERRMGYIADIMNPDGTLFDRVFIDKRIGRIRSIR